MQVPLWFNRGQRRPWTSLPRIDWSHQLAQGLVFCGYDTGGGTIIDLVSGKAAGALLSVSSGGAVYPSNLGTPYGQATYYPAAAYNSQPQWAQGVLSQVNAFASASPYSVLAVWWQQTLAQQAASDFPQLYSIDDSGGNASSGIWFTDADTTKLEFGNENVSVAAATGTISANSFYVAVGSQSAASTATLYLNGKSVASGALANYTLTSAAYMSWIGWGPRSLAGNANGTRNGAVVFLQALWKGRALTQGDALAFYNDPYQFLVYPEDEIFATLVGAVSLPPVTPVPGLIMARTTPGLGPRAHYTALLNASLPVPVVAPPITGSTLPTLGVG